MARKKRKTRAISNPTSTQGPKRSRKGPRPSEEWIEVPSDEEDASTPTEHTGAARGLSANNILPSRTTAETIETVQDENTSSKAGGETKPNTRSARNGHSNINYDMKYHPTYDNAIRPAFAARRRSGSRSRSATMFRDGEETEEESLPSSALNSDSDSEASSNLEEAPAAERVPDPNATRHSKRAQAHKPLNYSAKHHPSDAQLPGFQHKARKLKQDAKRAAKALAKTVTVTKQPSSAAVVVNKAKNVDEQISAIEDEVEQTSASEDELREPSRPHKRLRILSDDRQSPQKSKAAKGKKKATTSKGNGRPRALTNTVKEAINDISERQETPPEDDDEFSLMARKKAEAMASQAYQILSSDRTPMDTSENPASDLAKVGEHSYPEERMGPRKATHRQSQLMSDADKENEQSRLQSFSRFAASQPDLSRNVKFTTTPATGESDILLSDPPLPSEFEDLLFEDTEKHTQPSEDKQDQLTSGTLLDDVPVSQRERSDGFEHPPREDDALPPSNQMHKSTLRQHKKEAAEPTNQYPSPAENCDKPSNSFSTVNTYRVPVQVEHVLTQLEGESAELRPVDDLLHKFTTIGPESDHDPPSTDSGIDGGIHAETA